MANAPQDIVQRLLFNESRSTSAPPQVDRTGASEVLTLEELEKQAYRAHPDYHILYFQQKPPDPRLPKPLFAWNLPKGYEAVLKKAYKQTFDFTNIISDLKNSNSRLKEETQKTDTGDNPNPEEHQDSSQPHNQENYAPRGEKPLDDDIDEREESDDVSSQNSSDEEESEEDNSENSNSSNNTSDNDSNVSSGEEESDENYYQNTYNTFGYPVPNYTMPFQNTYMYQMEQNAPADYVAMSKEHHGSRSVQQNIEKGTADERLTIWRAIQSHIVELSADLFANYVIQKALEFVPESRHAVPAQMKNNVLRLTLHMYGCRVVQKAVEYAAMKDRKLLFEELRGHLVQCIEDQNGNHVIQKCVEKGDRSMVMDVVKALNGIVLECCRHPYGCRVVQRVIESVDYDCVVDLLKIIEPQSLNLTEDQYGNYVVQNVLERGYDNDRHIILTKLKGNIVRLSMGKYSSNVIEKCFKHATQNERAQILEEIYVNDGIVKMMQDQFANYVVQKIIEAVNDVDREKIVEGFIKPNIALLKKVSYTKHILNLLESVYNVHL
ncbi:pumilio domain containing protein C4G8.03C, putative [Entamoeba invadens IP1]|uniref:Pumilio domain containing protein C4G8.03C, putative n=1 Tax=Entamoeba invadens IP1 TaxID=370355 RepID=A0A0A1UFF8_ENTIV|nr:pumilio domain containing protein C4G8.03C, putative [Entamoeba invadens IP1]ELP95233.1 pumilio domain containing protein C4G8.03C, putative [Entamoeba invadens IP1]|eukprot:XP_004262004.1 pumilio domain containing protein C4G8.03C, putative [Entamoeba invadens IP1]